MKTAMQGPANAALAMLFPALQTALAIGEAGLSTISTLAQGGHEEVSNTLFSALQGLAEVASAMLCQALQTAPAVIEEVLNNLNKEGMNICKTDIM